MSEKVFHSVRELNMFLQSIPEGEVVTIITGDDPYEPAEGEDVYVLKPDGRPALRITAEEEGIDEIDRSSGDVTDG